MNKRNWVLIEKCQNFGKIFALLNVGGRFFANANILTNFWIFMNCMAWYQQHFAIFLASFYFRKSFFAIGAFIKDVYLCGGPGRLDLLKRIKIAQKDDHKARVSSTPKAIASISTQKGWGRWHLCFWLAKAEKEAALILCARCWKMRPSSRAHQSFPSGFRA